MQAGEELHGLSIGTRRIGVSGFGRPATDERVKEACDELSEPIGCRGAVGRFQDPSACHWALAAKDRSSTILKARLP